MTNRLESLYTKGNIFVIDTENGKIGINNPGPSELLDINGNIKTKNINAVNNYLKDGKILNVDTLKVESRYKNAQILDIHKEQKSSTKLTINHNSEAQLFSYNYTKNTNVKQININYKFFITFHGGDSQSFVPNLPGVKYGSDRILQVFIEIKDKSAATQILKQTIDYIHLDSIEKYVTINTIIDLDADVNNPIAKQLVNDDYTIIVTAKSLYQSIIIHRNHNNIEKKDQLNIFSIGYLNNFVNSDNESMIIDYNCELIKEDNGQLITYGNVFEYVIKSDFTINPRTETIYINFSPFVSFTKTNLNSGINNAEVILKYEMILNNETIASELVKLEFFESFVTFLGEKTYSDQNQIPTQPIDIKIKITNMINHTDSNVNIFMNQYNILKSSKLTIISDGKRNTENINNQIMNYLNFPLNGNNLNINNSDTINAETISEKLTIPFDSHEVSSQTSGLILNSDEIKQNWTQIDLLRDYLPPVNSHTVHIKCRLFLTYEENLGITKGNKENTGFFEVIFKIGDTLIPNSVQKKYIDLTQKYCFIDTIIKIGVNNDINQNKLSWSGSKNITIYLRSIINNVKYKVTLHNEQGNVDLFTIPTLEVISIGNFDTSAVTTQSTSSDDRVKHNEVNITNAINVIEKLQPKKYIKTKHLYSKNHNFKLNSDGLPITENNSLLNVNYIIETGLIAQDINDIPELQYTVNGYVKDSSGSLIENPYEPLSIRYNDIFVYAIQAIKELSEQNKLLLTKNKSLEDEINIIKDKVEALEKK